MKRKRNEYIDLNDTLDDDRESTLTKHRSVGQHAKNAAYRMLVKEGFFGDVGVVHLQTVETRITA